MRCCGAEMRGAADTRKQADGPRMMRSRKILALGLVPALGFVLANGAPVKPLATQQQPADQSADPHAIIRSTVELVVVPVTVKDPGGGLVADVRQDEFRVFEDGVEQHISLFSVDPFPLSAVVLVDDDLKTKAAAAVQQSLVAIAGGFSVSDEVALSRFDAFYTSVLDFTADNDRLITELKRMELNSSFPGVGSDPMTAVPSINNEPAPGAPTPAQTPIRGLTTKHLNDGIHAAAEALRSLPRERRKVVIIVSDGANARNNTYSYDDTLKLLLSADISVYAIGVDAAVLNRRTSLLSRYAHATGGDVYYAAHGSDLPDFYSQVAEQARHQYTIGYVPARTDRAKDYHAIEVRIRRLGLTLLARDGYYLASHP
jgi:VWFA-related protein